jgi:AAA+ ATPase superfamily predicted ATPase
VEFVGRIQELHLLRRELKRIKPAESRPGRCLLLQGRRRIGKSALVEKFIDDSGLPSMFFTAARLDANVELERLTDAIAESSLPHRSVFAETAPSAWHGALRLLADTVPDDKPSVLVLDEVPYLMDKVDGFEGSLQAAWDRYLSRKPVLLLLIGSDLSMMETLNAYDRPFHQRGTEMVLGPLNPAELSTMLGLAPAEAFDAALVTGGLPLIAAEWAHGAPMWDFLAEALANPTSALLVSAERTIAAEFPAEARADSVIEAVAGGERTFSNIARAAGNIAHPTLNRALNVLVAKGIVTSALPLSTRPSRERRYWVTDPYLRFWLRFLKPAMPEIERLRGDLTLANVRRGWSSWRGRAVEPLIRAALARLLPDSQLPAARAIGGYWTRGNDVGIDIVGGDREPIAKELLFIGSIKWLDNAAFDDHDFAALRRHGDHLTSKRLPLVAASRAGISAAGVDAEYGPDDLIAGWSG